MIIYSRKKGYRKGNQSNIPNVLAFTMIRSFLNDKSYKDMRKEYFIRNVLETGISILNPNARIAPVEGKLYKLRNE